jgi:molybdate transport system substrate-binding protein
MSMGSIAYRIFAASCGLALMTSAGVAAEIRMRATGAVQHTLIELAEAFHKQTGHTVKAAFGTAGVVSKLIVDGEALEGAPADVVFSSAESLRAPAVAAKLAAGAPVAVGQVRIGIGVRNGDTAPDISTPEALKAALLAAPSFAYGDPAAGATTGIHFAKLLDQMGIADSVKAKALLRRGGLLVMKEVADGKTPFGFTQTSEIKAVPGVRVAGLLPDAFQLVTVYAGALTRDAKETEAAGAFIAFVTGPAGQAAFHHHGFESVK